MFLCNFKGEWWDDYEATSTSATAPYIARSVSANTVILFWLILLHEHSFYLRVMSDKEKKINYLAET